MPPKKPKSSASKATASAVISPYYYQNKIYSSDYLESVFSEFFPKIDHCSIHNISDLLSGLAKRGDGKIPQESLPPLLKRINILAQHPETAPSVAEIGIMLNYFANLGYKKSDLEILNIKNFTSVFNALEKPTSKDIFRITNGLACLHYDLRETGFITEKLSGAINAQFGNFSAEQKINLLNSLARFGNFGHPQTLQKLARESARELTTLESKDIAAFTHSCAKLKLFDQLTASKADIAASLIPSSLSSNAAFSLLQAHMFYDLSLGQKLFDEPTILEIAAKYSHQPAKISKMQQSTANNLEAMGYKVEQEFTIYQLAGIPIKEIDICATKKSSDGDIDNFLEFDGTSHFFRSETGEHVLDFESEQRDAFNEAAIAARTDSINQSRYNTISFLQTDSLAEIVASAKEIGVRSYEEFLSQISQQTLKEEVVEGHISSHLAPSGAKEETSSKSKKKKKKKPAAAAKSSSETSCDAEFECAIETGDVAGVEAAIRDGIDVNQIFTNGLNPFSLAASAKRRSTDFFKESDYSTILDSLINAGATISSAANSKEELETLLDDAVFLNRETLACALLRLDSINLKPSIIVKAAEFNLAKVVDAIIERSDFNPSSREAKAALNAATTERSDLKILASLIKGGVGSNHIRDNASHNLKRNLLLRSLKEDCAEIFIPLVEQNRLDRNVLFGTHVNDEDLTLLHYAAAIGNAEIVRFLTDASKKHGVDANLMVGMRSPLVIAVNGKHLSVAKVLIEERGVSPDQYSATGINPIGKAAHVADKEMITYLVGAGANIDSPLDLQKFAIFYPDILTNNDLSQGSTTNPIITAVINNHPEIIDLLVDLGAKTELPSPQGDTSIANSAISSIKPNYLRTIANSKVSLTTPQKFRGKDILPIELALTCESPPSKISQVSEIVTILTQNGVDPNTALTVEGNHVTAFLMAIANAKISQDTLQIMIDHGADCIGSSPETRYKRTITPIQIAYTTSAQAMELLLRNGANVNTVMNNGAPLLVDAIREQNLEKVKILVKYGANLTSPQGKPDPATGRMETPLEFATKPESTSPEIVKFLTAQIASRNSPSVSPYQLTETRSLKKSAPVISTGKF
jgi:ankyrin repeat protein